MREKSKFEFNCQFAPSHEKIALHVIAAQIIRTPGGRRPRVEGVECSTVEEVLLDLAKLEKEEEEAG